MAVTKDAKDMFIEEMQKYYGKPSEVGQNIKKSAKATKDEFVKNAKAFGKGAVKAYNDPVNQVTLGLLTSGVGTGVNALTKIPKIAKGAKAVAKNVKSLMKKGKRSSRPYAGTNPGIAKEVKKGLTEVNTGVTEVMKKSKGGLTEVTQSNKKGLTEVMTPKDRYPKVFNRKGGVTEVKPGVTEVRRGITEVKPGVAEAAKKPINKVVKRLKGKKLDKKKSADKLYPTNVGRDFDESLKEYNRTENLFKQQQRQRGGLTEVDKTVRRNKGVTEVTEDELNALKKKIEDLPDDEWDDIMGKLERMGRSQDRANRRARKLSNKFIVSSNELPRKHPDYEESWTALKGFKTKDGRRIYAGQEVINKEKNYTDYATGLGAPNANIRIPRKPKTGGVTEVTPEEQMDDIAKKFLEKRKNRKGKGTKKKKKKEE